MILPASDIAQPRKKNKGRWERARRSRHLRQTTIATGSKSSADKTLEVANANTQPIEKVLQALATTYCKGQIAHCDCFPGTRCGQIAQANTIPIKVDGRNALRLSLPRASSNFGGLINSGDVIRPGCYGRQLDMHDSLVGRHGNPSEKWAQKEQTTYASHARKFIIPQSCLE